MKTLKPSSKILISGGLAGSAMAGNSAHAQIITDYNLTAEATTANYSIVMDLTGGPGGAPIVAYDDMVNQQLQLSTSVSKLFIQDSGVAVSDPLTLGATVDSSLSFPHAYGGGGTGASIPNDAGTYYYGVQVTSGSDVNYGYIEFTEGTSQAGNETFTLNEIGYNPTVNGAVVTPEPSATSLLALGAAGAAGLALFRRRAQAA